MDWQQEEALWRYSLIREPADARLSCGERAMPADHVRRLLSLLRASTLCRTTATLACRNYVTLNRRSYDPVDADTRIAGGPSVGRSASRV